MFEHLLWNNYYDEAYIIDWSRVLQEDNPDLTLEVFTKLSVSIIDKHAPVWRLTCYCSMVGPRTQSTHGAEKKLKPS